MNWFTSLISMVLIACEDKDNSISEAEYVEGSNPGDCTDDFDNDFDGLKDCEDDGCSEATVCLPDEERDRDEDGFTPLDGDCDDNDASIYPGAPRLVRWRGLRLRQETQIMTKIKMAMTRATMVEPIATIEIPPSTKVPRTHEGRCRLRLRRKLRLRPRWGW